MGADGLAAQSHHPLRQIPQRGNGEVGTAEKEHGRRVLAGLSPFLFAAFISEETPLYT